MAAVSARRLLPWAGVIGAGLGWFLSQQASSNMVFAACGAGHWWSVGLLGLLGLGCVASGAFLSWRGWRAEREADETRRFVGLLGLMVSALLSFPILLQIIGGLVVPGCVS